MYLEESPYQRDQLINIDQLVGRALDHGVELGDNHHQTIENYVNFGLVPRLLNGQFPATALDRLVFVDSMLKQGKSIEVIKKTLENERKKFLKKPMDLSSLVDAYKGASKSLLMLGSVGFVVFLLTSLFISLPDSGIKKSVGQPVGRVLAEFIKEAKPANSTSTDPLGLTNVSKVITINEKQEVVIQKTINADSSAPVSSNNSLITNDSLTVGSIDVKSILSKEITFPNLTGATGNCVLTLDIAQVLSCNQNQYWTASSIKDIAETSVTSGLSGLNLTGSGINVSRTGNTFALSLANEAIASIAGVKNNGGDVSFVAGAGVTITANDSANTITFNLAGSGVNADLLDSIDSTQFLRSDTSDNFTAGTLTFDAATTLSVSGTFTCASCLTDSAVSDTLTLGTSSSISATALNSGTLGNASVTLALGSFGSITGSLNDANVSNSITASNYLPLTGGTLTGASSIAYTTGVGNTTNLSINTANVLTSGTDVNLIGLNIALNNGANGTGNPLTEGINVDAQYTSDDVGVNVYGMRAKAAFNPSNISTAVDLVGITAQVQCCGSSPFSPTNIVGIRIESPIGTSSVGLLIKDQSGQAIVTEGTSSSSFGGAVSVTGALSSTALLSASTGSTSAVGFNLNTAQAGPTCGSLNNGDFGFDSSNNRIFWKGTGGTCSYWNRTGTFDIAEHAPASEAVEPGDILVIDTTSPTFAVKKSSSPYQQTVVGIESTDPTLVSNPELLGPHNFVSKLALAGRVPTKVSTENGAINPGDYLTTSSTAGVAMKASSTGPTIGKALEAYNGSDIGKIIVFVSNSYYVNLSEAPKYGLQSDTNYLTSIISKTGEAIFSKVTTLFASVGKLVFGEIAVKKDSQSAGVSEISDGQSEVVIQSSKVKSDSLINLTASSEPDGVLYIKSKTPGENFVVGIKRFPGSTTSSKIDFNWLIVNQE